MPQQIPLYERRGDVPAGLYTASQLSRLEPRRVLLPDAQPTGLLKYREGTLELYRLEGTRARYSRVEYAPEDLYSKTALAHMDPPRKPAPDAAPAAEATYHGNQTALLYRLEDTVLKPPATQKQRSSLDRARGLQHVCKRCAATTYPGAPDTPPSGRVEPWGGRLCCRCRAVTDAHGYHLERQRWAQRMMTELTLRTPIVVAADQTHEPTRLALVAFHHLHQHDGRWRVGRPELLADLTLTGKPGEGTNTVEHVLYGLDRPAALIGWKKPTWSLVQAVAGRGEDLWTTLRDSHPQLADDLHAMPDYAVRETWTTWHYEPRPGYGPEGMEPTTRWRPEPNWQNTFDPFDPDVLTGSTELIGRLAGVADGTAPVHPDAPWLHHPPTAPGYDGP